MLEAVASQVHLGELRQSIPDYDSERDRIVEWALSDKQPRILRNEFERVIREGTTEEGLELYRLYKEASAQQESVRATSSKKVTELPAPAKKAAALLAPVSSKRSTAVTSSVDPNDFESAFAMAAKDL
jgi:hypothetical protein